MHVSAFVLSRPRDYAMAEKCAARLMSFGWTAKILVDPLEWDTIPNGSVAADYASKRRMVGLQCAKAILSAITSNASDGHVAKFDCDVRLRDDVATWLAEGRNARTTRLGTQPWGAFWVAPRWQAINAMDWLETAEPCNCPESKLILSGLRYRGGLDVHDDPSVKWVPGREWPYHAAAVTLPAPCPPPGRAYCGDALFSACHP